MTPLEKQIKEKQYQDYVKQHTPVHNVWTNMLKAFLTGGSICTIGQLISTIVILWAYLKKIVVPGLL